MELIVLDDGSPDRTYEIASDLCASARYRERFDRILCWQNEHNLGAHATLNKGIALASGDYVSLLNSDDQYHPARLETLVGALRNSPSLLAFSNYVFMDDDGNEVHGHPLYHELQAALASAPRDYPSLSFAFLQKQIALSTGNFVFARELFELVGGFADLKYCHDWDFILQSTRYAEPHHVDEDLYRYRVHATNTFNELSGIAAAETEFVLQRFFSNSLHVGTPNPGAATEQNWPGLFPVLINKFGLDDLYTRVVTGYLPWHRTIN
jgi:glycosyltransferase involved in cell wall biosynthesis